MGKIATDTYTTGNYLRQEREVIRVVGSECFQHGLLIGHKDSRLLKNETADILLSYPHRSIEEFLAAFILVITANDGILILLQENIWLLLNPVVFKFCLWLLYSAENFITVKNRQDIISQLQDFVLPVMNNTHVEFHDVDILYRTFNITEAINENNELCLKFFGNVLNRCSDVKHLTFYSHVSVSWTLQVMSKIFQKLKSIILSLHEISLRHVPLDIDNLYAQEVTCLKVTIYNSTLHGTLLKHLLDRCKI